MAITENMEFPQLTPREDKAPSVSRLFRRAEELTDEQFDLLAAARSEEALTGEALEELESLLMADPERMVRADSFMKLRLTPFEESWPDMQSSFRSSPGLTVLKRTVIPALLAVAAMIVFVIYGPVVAKLKTAHSGKTAGESVMADAVITGSEKVAVIAEIPASMPIVAVRKATMSRETPAVVERRSTVIQEYAVSAPGTLPSEIRPEIAETADASRTQPLILAHGQKMPGSVAPVVNPALASLSIRHIQIPQAPQEEKNWMLRSISFLASAMTGKEKKIDGYMIASGAITGINSILGWDMELERVSNKRGEPVAVSFSSSLLSFTKPLNKSAR